MAVYPKAFAKITNLICKANLNSMERVARVLNHFGLSNGGLLDRCGDTGKQLCNRVGRVSVGCSEDRERRMKEIRNCCGFTHELRVHTHVEVNTASLVRISLQLRNDYAFNCPRQNGASDANYSLSTGAL